MRKIKSLFLALGLCCALAVALAVEAFGATATPSQSKAPTMSYDSGMTAPESQTQQGQQSTPREGQSIPKSSTPKDYIRTN